VGTKRTARCVRRSYFMGPRVLLLAIPFVVWAQAPDPAIEIPPVKTSFEIDGQAASITAWGVVRMASPRGFQVSLTADLSDRAQNATPLMRAELNRSDRCGDRLSVDHALLVPAAPAAVLTAYVHLRTLGLRQSLRQGNGQAARRRQCRHRGKTHALG